MVTVMLVFFCGFPKIGGLLSLGKPSYLVLAYKTPLIMNYEAMKYLQLQKIKQYLLNKIQT